MRCCARRRPAPSLPASNHRQFTTLREVVLAHSGEALEAYQQDCVVDFLKSLQILPPGTSHLIMDEDGKPRSWHPLPEGRNAIEDRRQM